MSDYTSEAEGVTRFEVIDHRNPKERTATEAALARVFVAYDCKVMFSIQDDGRTLKIFVNDQDKDDEDG